MNILWIQDMKPSDLRGGAQITDNYMIEELHRRGHEVIWKPDPSLYIAEWADEIDSVVISNAKAKINFSKDLRDQLYDFNIPWIKYEHDHACYWRAYFPFNPKCQGNKCPAKDKYGWQYTGARGIVYLSLYQQEAHNFWNGFAMKSVKNHISPSYIDYKKFEEASDKFDGVRKDTLLLASLYRFKGYKSNITYAKNRKERNFHHYGQMTFSNEDISKIEHNNIILKESLVYTGIPELMARYDKFLHLLENFLPFERVALEAFFSGLSVTTNKNAGVTSHSWWGKYDESVHAMDETRENFVDFFEEVTK